MSLIKQLAMAVGFSGPREASPVTLFKSIQGGGGEVDFSAIGVAGTNYETVAASATDQVMGAAGAAGDLLNGVLIVPASTSPGAVTIKDGGGGAITIFAGGASSISSLVPFFVYLGAKSGSGPWKISTGASVSAIGVGSFT